MPYGRCIDLEFSPRADAPVHRRRQTRAQRHARPEQWREHNGVFVRFFLQPYMSARMDTYETLRAQLNAWLDDKLVRLRAAS